jgi:cytochrome P450
LLGVFRQNQLLGGAKYGDMATYLQSWQEFKAYVSQIIEARRRSPRNDLVSALV